MKNRILSCLVCLGLLLSRSLLASDYCAFFNETKHNEYNFLSNFYEKTIDSPLGNFRCAEGLYQYLKFAYLKDTQLKASFQKASGQEAWDLSRSLSDKTNPHWNKEKAMKEVLRVKFSDKELKEGLMDTGSAYLVENSPFGHDIFWADNGDGKGQNKLGTMLMQLREELGGTGIVQKPDSLKNFYTKKCEQCENPCHFTNYGVVYNHCDAHMSRELKLGNVSTSIFLSNIPDGTGRFLYFNLNDMPEFIEEGARLIVERIKELGLKNPYFVTPETSTIALAHVLRTKYNIDGLVLSKRKKPNDAEVYSLDYCAVTSLETKTLFIEKSIDLSGKDIVIIDNVCTTGETLRAVYKLLCMAGADCKKIAEAIVLFTEGEDLKNIEIASDLNLNIHKFSHIPIYPVDPNIDNTLFTFFSSCDLPTSYGPLKFCVFKHRSCDQEAIACISPITLQSGVLTNVPVRIHDACITSETFHSLKCDCQLQLDKTLEFISEYGGIVIYLKQEGRGIGLANKIAAYDLQETKHLDTVEANRALGLPDDMREYTAARDVLKHFNIQSIMLLTNNQRKVECLEKLGVTVAGRMPCVVKPRSTQMAKYMKDKTEQMGHIIPPDKLAYTP